MKVWGNWILEAQEARTRYLDKEQGRGEKKEENMKDLNSGSGGKENKIPGAVKGRERREKWRGGKGLDATNEGTRDKLTGGRGG